MSRSFQPTELVDGLIQVGFFYENQVLAVGGELIGTGAERRTARHGRSHNLTHSAHLQSPSGSPSALC
ncbi:MAG: hypothetical protein HY823_14035 [Acidobacteria bacterium]|nr:hypothetical protein [Acidobacteriota bacterium]